MQLSLAFIITPYLLSLLLVGMAIWGGFCWRRSRRHEDEVRRLSDRYQQVFEGTSIAIIEEDFTPAVRRLDRLRAAGVTDLAAHLAGQSGLAAEIFRSIEILNANSHARALIGAADLPDYRKRMQELSAQRPPRAFADELLALWDGRSHVSVQISFRSAAGQDYTGILQWRLIDETGRGGIARALITFSDLSALHASEARYQQLFEGAFEGVYEATLEDGFISANPALARILGYGSPDELLALSTAQMQALYLDAQRHRQFHAELEAKNAVHDFEARIRRRDGAIIWIGEHARGMRNERGRLVRYQGFVSDITPRKAAEKALRESEDRWRLAVQASAVGLWENNLLTGENFYSDRSKEILGFAPHEISDSREAWTARIHPDDMKLGIKAMQDHLAGRSPYYEVEHRFRCKDGSYKWIMSRGSALFDTDNRATRILGTHLDISERRQMEEQLRRSEVRYRMLFEHSPVGIAEFDFAPGWAWLEQRRAEGVTDLREYFEKNAGRLAEVMTPVRLTGLNAAAVQLVGAGSKEEVLHNLPRIMTPDVLRARVEFFICVWEGRRKYESELTINALDGSPRKLHSHWWIPLVAGEPNYHQSQLTLVDLTHLKSTELALEQERERLQVTLRAMAEGVVTVDPQGVVHFVNAAACGLLGLTESRIVGRPFAELCTLLHGTTRVQLSAWVESVQAGGRLVELPPQAILVRADGRQLVVDGRGAPMHDQTGRTMGAVLVLRDVSERSRLESELQRAARIESVGLLAGGIAHDFNNILAAVMGNLTLAMMDDTVKGSRAARWLGEAEKATLRARDLTQQLLTFSRGGEPVRTAVQLVDLVREAAGFSLHGANVRCEFDLADDLWPAQADKGQIGQVVQNLVLNAVQAMPGGGVIRITLRNEQLGDVSPPLAPGRYLKLSVKDQGPGIATEHLGRIFEPYFTTKAQGFGLGLATAYSIVKKHGGNIVVDTAADCGAAFHVWLPAAEQKVAARAASQSPFELMHGRVLFMDDEPPIRQMAVVLLARLGLETVTAEDGAEAVRLYEQARVEHRPFDVVVMDLTVPGGMGGREAMERLRRMDPEVRAIVTSGYSSDPVMANYRDYGFQAMIAKPYRIADFVAALRTVLGPA